MAANSDQCLYCNRPFGEHTELAQRAYGSLPCRLSRSGFVKRRRPEPIEPDPEVLVDFNLLEDRDEPTTPAEPDAADWDRIRAVFATDPARRAFLIRLVVAADACATEDQVLVLALTERLRPDVPR